MFTKEFYQTNIFITGSASGIGQAQTIAFLEKGANVLGMDCNNLEETINKAQGLAGNFIPFQGDITNQKSIREAVNKINQNYGAIKILLNTAGILDNYATSLETSEELWDLVISVNLKGTYLVTNSILPQMLEEKIGIIINMASIAGMTVGGGGAAYTASKHALIGYTKQLTYDYAKKGIRVNAIAPGAIKTPMNAADFSGDGEMASWVAKETPAQRWASPEEVASLTLFIASKQADYLHGSIIPIDGGWLSK
ncbi:3-oxoacyl-ACP reductase [Enterococcus rivorum]|uniref:3-oxoacyl-ACP reductase n=1 Tax=Enterococcus rivorum TaxID=762845 RepID=A0A1E5KVX6_9ENTE|nr:3-oxoacyl-ACP reductase [Enterococcus rivorum]MBP2100244.1 3-oxoacyl-[acyl-carrier protein] reductase [Enterococcus rivorum]OEH82037.1 3-oxoacyl-ACP reductase [Enterococcus rivorum]